MNRDPLGEAGGINLYGFSGNNPVNWVDPWGLITAEKLIKLWETTSEAKNSVACATFFNNCQEDSCFSCCLGAIQYIPYPGTLPQAQCHMLCNSQEIRDKLCRKDCDTGTK